ncbi:hypothetical protein CEXT_285171 [Caerostris extrusa]|uniref:Uncharacterized protein n=1 Tax=Caerostris extrusa TaxID=172846 RepID=A0AAV4V8F1_CAEEX|nr:hypothetical protein CEXT_285171 [Caerostris extrusa]
MLSLAKQLVKTEMKEPYRAASVTGTIVPVCAELTAGPSRHFSGRGCARPSKSWFSCGKVEESCLPFTCTDRGLACGGPEREEPGWSWRSCDGHVDDVCRHTPGNPVWLALCEGLPARRKQGPLVGCAAQACIFPEALPYFKHLLENA